LQPQGLPPQTPRLWLAFLAWAKLGIQIRRKSFDAIPATIIHPVFTDKMAPRTWSTCASRA